MARRIELPPDEDALVKATGERIQGLRRRCALTRAALAVEAGVSVDQLAALERGHNVARSSTLESLAKALGTTVHYLLTGRRS